MQAREFYYILTNGFGAHSRAPLFANHTNGAFKAFKGSDPLNKARGVQVNKAFKQQVQGTSSRGQIP
jgi:hypothetical protein